MFDKADIIVKAGDGGDGAVSFRREKFVPAGGPDGGDGGDGGNVIVRADESAGSLNAFKKGRVYKAGRGGNGQGKKKFGKRGENLILTVPPGTVVIDKNKPQEDAVIADLDQPGEEAVIASGGKGGLGNVHFASSVNQVPRLAEKGEKGEERSLGLELRSIADVGIIGYPNVGKSTLLGAVSAANPRIANYPFTTLEPVLGVVEFGEKKFVIAEIPGLIEGAHMGKGLGYDFLRHTMRTRILIHLIDGTSESPVEDYFKVNNELNLYDPDLAKKPQIVAVNKQDLPQVREKVPKMRQVFSEIKLPVFFVSASTGEGLKELLAEVVRVLGQAQAIEKEEPTKIFRPQPIGAKTRVVKEDGAFRIVFPILERIVARVGMEDPEVQAQVRQYMNRTGINKELERAGIKPGDKVRCGEYEWDW
jgi:GTPase